MGCILNICFKNSSNNITQLNSNNNNPFGDTQFTFITEGGNNFSEDLVTSEDFEKLKLLGRGTFGEVFLVRHIYNKKLFAMKILRKKALKIKNQELNTRTERMILEKIKHQNIVSLFYAFQDKKKLYLVTEFIQGGELFYHLYRSNTFEPHRARFYAANIVLALEYLHSNNCIYRDLKPENLLIGKDGYIKLTDFGLSKMLLEKNETKTYSICGTLGYLAPEMLLDKGYDKTVDWWSLGTLLFNMLNGRKPFRLEEKPFTFDQYYQPIKFTYHCPEDAKNFITQLLVIDPTKRLGYGPDGTQKIKDDEYFKDIDWEALAAKTILAPFLPNFKNELDLQYFDYHFTSEKIAETLVDNITPYEDEENQYLGFSYIKRLNEEDPNYKSDDISLVTKKEG